MASGPPPPSISLSPSSAADSASDSLIQSLRASSPAPPSIILEPTSDGDGDDGDEPFHFEVDRADSPFGNEPPPYNPHAEALLRRSPSPTIDLLTSPLAGAQPSSPQFLSSSPTSHLLSPDPRFTSVKSFLRPPHAASDDTMEIQAPNSAPADSPFNFQTQYISTSPVKSVRVSSAVVSFCFLIGFWV